MIESQDQVDPVPSSDPTPNDDDSLFHAALSSPTSTDDGDSNLTSTPLNEIRDARVDDNHEPIPASSLHPSFSLLHSSSSSSSSSSTPLLFPQRDDDTSTSGEESLSPLRPDAPVPLHAHAIPLRSSPSFPPHTFSSSPFPLHTDSPFTLPVYPPLSPEFLEYLARLPEDGARGAAARIQRWWRASMDLRMVRYAVLRAAWNAISESEESSGMLEFEQSLHLRSNKTLLASSRLWKSQDHLQRAFAYRRDDSSNRFDVDVHPGLFCPDFCDLLVANFCKGRLLGAQSALALLTATLALLRGRHASSLALVEWEDPHPELQRVTVVGDLHGQFKDLLLILEQNGRPGPQHMYIFNGDLVDRGAQGVEVCFVVFSLALAFPERVWINRGNHEALSMNLKYAFDVEVLRKYDDAMFLLFQDVFCALPLATVLNRRIFVAHGGLPPAPLSLADIAAIPLGAQPPSGVPDDPSGVVFKALLWNDPREDVVGTQPSGRGRGVAVFGPDVTQCFLERNGLSLVVRSHEQVENGYQTFHAHQLVTVFSASDYCGVNRNYGSVLNFRNAADLSQFEFFRYHAIPLASSPQAPHSSSSPQARAASSSVSSRMLEIQRQIVNYLADQIFLHLHDLRARFEAADALFSGRITLTAWKQIMARCLQLNLPWYSLRRLLIPENAYDDPSLASPEALLIFVNFLNGFQFTSSTALVDKWELVFLDHFFQKLVTNVTPESIQLEFESLRSHDDARMVLDPDKLIPFAQRWSIELSARQAEIICRALESRFMSTSSSDFLEYLHRHQQRIKHLKLHEEFWMNQVLSHVGQCLIREHHSLKSAYKSLDPKKRGYIRVKRFSKFLVTLPLPEKLSKEQCMALSRYIDIDGNGHLSFNEFEQFFTSPRELKRHYRWMRNSMDELARLIISNRSSLRRAFIEFDQDGSGSIDLNEFVRAITSLNPLLTKKLTPSEIVQLFHYLDADDSGHIEWSEFLELFSYRPVLTSPARPSASTPPPVSTANDSHQHHTSVHSLDFSSRGLPPSAHTSLKSSKGKKSASPKSKVSHLPLVHQSSEKSHKHSSSKKSSPRAHTSHVHPSHDRKESLHHSLPTKKKK